MTRAPAIVVFALDRALAARLHDALPHIEIHAADTVADLADLLVAKPCCALGVEVAALGAGASELLARLAGLFPDLPVVALGSAHDAPLVTPLLASGEVHAFLPRPVDPSAARDAFESAFRRNAALARSAALRRAAALRRSSTFLVRESRPEDDAARRSAGPDAPLPAAAFVRPARAGGAALACVGLAVGLAVAVLGAGGWLASQPVASDTHAESAPAASGADDAARSRTAAAMRPVAEYAAPRAVVAIEAAEQALAAGQIDYADRRAREALALAAGDPALATRGAAVLDGVAEERRARERSAIAEARWARAAREWERMRAEEQRSRESPDAGGTRTREATSEAQPRDAQPADAERPPRLERAD